MQNDRHPATDHQKRWTVFFDFDNTITSSDILDNIIARFSVNDDWKTSEKAWVEGKIGSRECLAKQLGGIRVTRQGLSDYLSEVLIDPFFGKLLELLRAKGIESMIVSDSFSFLIKEILRHNGIHGVKVYANELKFRKDRVQPAFPHINPNCLRCAHCKTRHLIEHEGKTKVYVGDGLSDICPAQNADIVFAKATLLEFFRKNKRPHLEFRDLKDVFNFFEDLEPLKAQSPKRSSKLR